MSILTSASGASVSRGYEYYKYKKVKNIKQLNDFEFEGYVRGSLKNPYYVKINIEHPRKSYCDCPYANGNTTCKHMVALYFELFPDEVDDYESWLNSDYDEDDEEYEDDYDYYYDDDYDEDDCDDDYKVHSSFEKPLFFDVVLENYINDLNVDELKNILLTELKNNEERTFKLYLENKYKKYLGEENSDFVFLDKINRRVQELVDFYDYNYNDFDKEILNIREKTKIEELYKNKVLRIQIDRILLNEKLSVYFDYRWIAEFYKKNKSDEEIRNYCEVLENYLDTLKHYSIKNNVPKSNILITIDLLNDFTIEEKAYSLLKNAKYLQYVDYVIENSKDFLLLYKYFMKLIEKNYFKNKIYIPEILYRFYRMTDYDNDLGKDININHYLYSYLCLGDIEYLSILNHYMKEKDIIDIIENKTKEIFLLVKLYKFYRKDEKLWNLLIDSNYKYLLLDNVDILKDRYNNELYEHFINEFYSILNEGKNREVYCKAVKYIKAIKLLNDGDILVNKILKDLGESNYKKCYALFDEIDKIVKK